MSSREEILENLRRQAGCPTPPHPCDVSCFHSLADFDQNIVEARSLKPVQMLNTHLEMIVELLLDIRALLSGQDAKRPAKEGM